MARLMNFLFLSIITLCCIVAILVVLFSGNSGSHHDRCRPNTNVIRFRNIVGSNITFSRGLVLQRPVSTHPDPVDISSLLDQNAGVHLPNSQHFRRLSNIFWVWFQFIDHDLILTKNGPSDDTLYAGLGMFPLIRTLARLDNHGKRQQVNFATPFLDGSHIYGNSIGEANHLRRLDGSGKLRSSFTPFQGGDDNELLPKNEFDQFEGADPRITEHPLLFALHALWLREHNAWCDRLIVEHPYMNENELYHTARHLVISELQVITYREALPLLLGKQSISPDCFDEDDDDFEPLKILNEFGAAVFRFGHTLITNTLQSRDPFAPEILQANLELKDVFNNPSFVWEHGISSTLLGASKQEAESRDARIVDAVRKHLFNNTVNSTQTIDLMARNMARGRDHELPSYQDFYRAFTGKDHVSCHEFAYSQVLCDRILAVYGSESAPIDLFLGILAERNAGSSLLGPVGTHILTRQFQEIKHKDRYFYLWDRVTDLYRAEIHDTTLARVILRNTPIPRHVLSKNVFVIID